MQIIVGKNIFLYRQLALKKAMELELKGLKLSRGVNVFQVARNDTGLTTKNRKKLYLEYCARYGFEPKAV